MANVDLGKQVGPLPLGAWIAVVAGGLGIALYTRRATNTPQVVTDTSGDPGVGVGGSGFTTVTPPTTSNTGDTSISPDTNDVWGVQAITWLIAHGYPSTGAESAIRKHLAGADDQLSTSEWAMLNIVMVAIGPPPQTLPPSGVTPPTIPPPSTLPPPPKSIPGPPKPAPKPPAPKPAPKPTLRTYIVRPGDNLSKIALRYYHKASDWPRIYNANRSKIRNPNLIYPGQVLVIP